LWQRELKSLKGGKKMKRFKKHYPMGIVSYGTLRAEDLIPAFITELEFLAGHSTRLTREINHAMKKEGYFGSEEADLDLNVSLFDAFQEFAAPYFYFGAHTGDGSDFGFWLSEEWEENFDGLKVGDLTEVPKNYAGEIMLVSDHGNLTLYSKARTQPPREIWSID
jgi:hypothetical protein